MALRDLNELKDRLRKFAIERDWDKFHDPKNISMALVVEVAEIIEHFQWVNGHESLDVDISKKESVSLELADVLMYLVRLADVLEIDLLEAFERKLDINDERFC